MSDSEQRFYEDDVITVRGNKYKITSVDRTLHGNVLQYRLATEEPDLAATLKVDGDEYVVTEHHAVEGEEITVIE